MNFTVTRQVSFFHLLFFSLFSICASAQFTEGEIYLKIKDTSSIELQYPVPAGLSGETATIYQIFDSYGVESIEKPFHYLSTPRLDRIYKVYFDNLNNIQDFITELEATSCVEYAEKVCIAETHIVPNDPSVPYQIALMGGYNAFDIHNGSIQGHKTTIAIIDDAVLTDHEDLFDNILPGYDVADLDNDPNPPFSGNNAAHANIFSHGTRVAGVSGAVTNNFIGIASIGWNSSLLPVKCIKDNAANTSGITHGYEGIAWAAANGAEVINISWGGRDYSQSGYEVIKAAREMGVAIVASAGNSINAIPNYPAAYGEGTTGQQWEEFDEGLVIAVASIDANGDRSVWEPNSTGQTGSNYGTWVDISAYGTDILSTVAESQDGLPDIDEYDSGSGTSFAAPAIAGLIALMISYQPDLPIQEIINCVINTANTDIYNPNSHPNNVPGTLGSGRIDANKALSCVSGCDHPTATIEPSSFYMCPGGVVELTANSGNAYLWSNGATTRTITPNTAATYSVTVTISGGCTASQNITLFQAPTTPIAYLLENSGLGINDGNLCDKDNFTVAGLLGSSYQWSFDPPAGVWNGQSLNFLGSQPIPSETEIFLTVTDLFGCPGVTGSTAITLNRQPSPNGILNVLENSGTLNDGLICTGASVNLSASGGEAYVWNTGATSSALNVTPLVTTTYSVTISNSSGCYAELEKTISVSTCAPYISCVECSNSPLSLNITASNLGTKYSTLGLPVTLDNYTCISISGTLIIDVNLEIKKCNNFKMSAGSEIIVGEDNNTGFHPTLTILDCEIFGCAQMWKGIRVKPFSQLVFKRNVIKDAEFAVQALSAPLLSLQQLPTRISIESNAFIDNHVGLFLPKTFGIANLWHYPISGNNFVKLAAGLLLPPTNINLRDYDPTSGFSGILSEGNGSSLSVGGPGASNYFTGLRNGILSKDQWTIIEEANFYNLKGYKGTQGMVGITNSPAGIGILFDGGFSTVTGSSFNKCGHGVYANRSLLGVNNNDMPNVKVGIQANSPALFEINSTADNQQQISFQEYGFLARNIPKLKALDFLSYSVENNLFSCIKASLESKGGILIENVQDPEILEKKAWVSDNVLDLEIFTNGINLRNHSNWDIFENAITPASSSSEGIKIDDCFNTYLLDNTVMATGKYDNIGISINNSDETEFCCNITANTYTGSNFFGPCASTIFRTTSMENNNYAVKCSDGTMLGDQPNLLLDPNRNYGNVFDGGFGTVLHEGSDILVGDSEFYVKSDNLPDFPNSVQTPNSFNSEWFHATGKNPDICDNCAPANLAPPRVPQIYFTDLQNIAGAYLNTNYGPMITWEGQYSLYKKLANNPSLMTGSNLLQTFYQNAQSGTIGSYYYVNNMIDNITSMPTALANNIKNYYNMVSQGQDYMHNLKLGILQAQTLADSLSVYNSVNQAQSSLILPFANFQKYLRDADSLRDLKIPLAIQTNEALVANNSLLSNIKTVNKIYLQTVASGNYSLSNEQFDQISAIANQCPLVGGKSVYKARSLYSLREVKNFDDDELCFQSNRNRNSFKEIPLDNSLHVVPNPANNLVEIYFPESFQKNEYLTCHVFDLTGKLISEKLYETVAGVLTFSVSDYPTGLYSCRITGKDHSPLVVKFIVQR